jgi:hypothetical protein
MGGWSMRLNITLEEGRVLDQVLQTIIKRPDVANIIYADYKEDFDLINKLAGRVKAACIQEGDNAKR